jgi:hypothetical protein
MFVERRRTSTISQARIFDGILDGISIFGAGKYASNQWTTCVVDHRVGMKVLDTVERNLILFGSGLEK